MKRKDKKPEPHSSPAGPDQGKAILTSILCHPVVNLMFLGSHTSHPLPLWLPRQLILRDRVSLDREVPSSCHGYQGPMAIGISGFRRWLENFTEVNSSNGHHPILWREGQQLNSALSLSVLNLPLSNFIWWPLVLVVWESPCTSVPSIILYIAISPFSHPFSKL